MRMVTLNDTQKVKTKIWDPDTVVVCNSPYSDIVEGPSSTGVLVVC